MRSDAELDPLELLPEELVSLSLLSELLVLVVCFFFALLAEFFHTGVAGSLSSMLSDTEPSVPLSSPRRASASSRPFSEAFVSVPGSFVRVVFAGFTVVPVLPSGLRCSPGLAVSVSMASSRPRCSITVLADKLFVVLMRIRTDSCRRIYLLGMVVFGVFFSFDFFCSKKVASSLAIVSQFLVK